jgi:hypothetical protein
MIPCAARHMRWSVVVPLALLALLRAAPAMAQDGAAHLVIISGLSGEERFASQFTAWGRALTAAATQRHGVPAANVVWLAENREADARIKDRSTLESVQRELGAIADRAGPNDRILIVVFGHGSVDGAEARLSMPGPDMSATELATMLVRFGERRVAVVNTTSASGGFVQKLAAPNRIVITATKSGMERNETVFGSHFVTALTTDSADVDKDNRVSLLEAYEYARREVERAYERDQKLKTEHSVIDAVGDGKGVAIAEPTTAHGRNAQAFNLGGGAVAAAASARTPELRAAYQEKARIETALDALRARKDKMPEAEYDAQLEKMLLDLSRNAQLIRRLEGGK